MNIEESNQELLNFFKALSDSNRLKIIGLLAQHELSVEQIAEMLQLKPSTVSHHLGKLSKAGLVSAHPESYYNIYRLEESILESMAKRLISKENLPGIAIDVDMDAYDRKVIKTYSLPDGSLKTIPLQQKKLQAVLKYVVEAFDMDKRYTEKQVNEILSRFNEDYALLRRELVEFGLMERQGGGGEYWRTG
jgi:DNA-binding HxlR family transcriptional regulator